MVNASASAPGPASPQPTRRTDRGPDQGAAAAGTSSNGAVAPDAPAPSTTRLYQAACPRCQHACRFTVPDAPGQAGGKLSVKCGSCEKPFAIQL